MVTKKSSKRPVKPTARAKAKNPAAKAPPLRFDAMRFRTQCTLIVTSSLVLSFALPLLAQDLVVRRPVNLRSSASTDSPPIQLLPIGSRLRLADAEKELGFYAVETADGKDGWVWARNVAQENVPSSAALRELTATAPSTGAAKCTRYGNAAPGSRDEATDKLKVRTAVPASGDVDKKVSFESMLAPGADLDRFDESRAAVIDAFVHRVKSGGPETVNCQGPSDTFDAHFELVSDIKNTSPTKFVVAEVTPQWRKIVGGEGGDWSRTHLSDLLTKKHVRITGWLLRDWRHAGVAQNTGKPATAKERATVWEIHPITKIEVFESGKWNVVR